MADPRDQDIPEAQPEGGQASRDTSGGPQPIGMGRGYGRDFGGGGLNQGADGSWGQGYGGSVAPSDYREGLGGEAYAGGMSGADYERSHGARGGDFGGDDRSWMDRREEQGRPLAGPHGGRGPKGWSRTDERLREAVCEAMMHDRLLDARGIEVQVEDRTVILAGHVGGASDITLAEMIARRVAGVSDVQSTLTVDGGRDPRPELGSRTSAYAPNVPGGESDEDGRRQGPWPSPSGAA